MPIVDADFWRSKRVLLTGHTGFKGAWCALWLARMGAEVTGLSLVPGSEPNLFELAAIDKHVTSRIGDLRDRPTVQKVVHESAPQIVLHLAAQPLVRRSFREPVETIATNVLGTAHLLDALRGADGLRCILVVTTDKVYDNHEQGRPFKEGDPLGGHDPYSASKAAAEIVARAMGASYFESRGIPVATARGGNVIGGGDFSEDRLVPDIVRAVMRGERVRLRHPDAVRPWQHVLDCLAGYLAFAQNLSEGIPLPRALNFGPQETDGTPVAALTAALLSAFGSDASWSIDPHPGPKEARLLVLDTSLARETLGWRDRLRGEAALTATAEWYRAFAEGEDPMRTTIAQIDAYMAGSHAARAETQR